MDIEFTRGDTQILKFKLKDKKGEEIKLSDSDKLFFTVKKTPNSKQVAFQKRLGNGITLKDDGYYYIVIDSSDTANLSYSTYGFDIQVKTEIGVVKTLLIGSMTLTEEYTHKEDEV